MVIPSLIGKYQERVAVTRVRKVYAILQQAVKLSIADNGEPIVWDIPKEVKPANARKAASYLTPYLRLAKDCGVESGCIKYRSPLKYLNGNDYNSNYDTNKSYYKIILADSSYVIISANKYRVMQILTDTNGAYPPNTVGKDIFEFYITDEELRAAGSGSSACNKTDSGWGCASYVLQFGNMNYLK